MSLDENQFMYIANKELESIYDLFDSCDQAGDLDIDFENEVLKITSSLGQHVINKNTAARQIWISSPVSGPHHFSYEDSTWISKSGVQFRNLIEQEFKLISFNLLDRKN